jgi:hypothetical protein
MSSAVDEQVAACQERTALAQIIATLKAFEEPNTAVAARDAKREASINFSTIVCGFTGIAQSL